VVVQDKQTVIIGGLMQEREDEKVTKVPFLGDIPLLGWLFKTKNVEKDKINLVVFITPHVVREADKLSQLSQEKHKAFARASEKYADGELLVKFRDGVSDEEARTIVAARGAAIIRVIESIGVYHIALRKGQNVQEAIKEFGELPQVQYAEPNYTVRMQDTR
jgi:general secretion pathway protein D